MKFFIKDFFSKCDQILVKFTEEILIGKRHFLCSLVIDNLSVRMYVNQMENITTFQIKKGYYLELLTPETIKLLGITKSEITENKNGENFLV